jgi:flagellar basal body-associated protein FliL
MAFCNSCGATLNPGTRFCNKCGAPILASTLPPTATPSTPAASTAPVAYPPVPTQGGSALKVILIVVGVVVLLGAISIASIAIFAVHTLKGRNTHIHQDGNNVKVDTPFGSVETTQDPAEAARNLGVDVYPGAEISKNGAATATFGGMHTASLTSESADSVDKVSAFYKAKFPNAMVSTSDANRCTIISNDKQSMVTINIQADGDKTKIQITNVTKSTPSTSSN